jgi:hypothetical protein
MQKYKKYRIITKPTIDELQEAVQMAVEDNWMPMGGVVVEVYPTLPPKYYQSVVLPIYK